MVRKIYFFIFIAIITFGLFLYFKPATTKIENENKVGDVVNNTNSSTKYLVFSKNILNEPNNSKRVLFFFANWCPTCIPVDKEFTNNQSRIPEGISVIRINYDDSDTDADEKELANKYGITYQHTFVQIGADGEVISKWNGGGIDKLISIIK